MKNKRIAVKYCGGCNPYHNRKAWVSGLEKKYNIRVEYAKPNIKYDEIYVVCGCQVCCADINQLQADQMYFVDQNGIREELTRNSR